VLDDVERRRFLVQPARKDSLPSPLRIADVELDEGAGKRLNLPGRGRLAGPEPNDGVADANRLARLQGQVPGDSVALVEQSEHRHPLRHRGRPGGDGGDGLRDVDRPRLADGLAIAAGRLFGAPAAAGEGGDGEESGAEREPHAWSGVQAS
jgi:hypothetical protein